MGELDTKWELQLMLLGKPENMFRVSVGSFGDRELLWEHKPYSSISEPFPSHKAPNFPNQNLEAIRCQLL